jgi:broad-specificity NMP kinase
MKKKIIKQGGTYTLGEGVETLDELQAGNYLLKHNMKTGYYLVEKPEFILPKKLYGDHSITSRWMKSYQVNSEKNLGIILSGIKGAGKTITCQKFCMESKMPVIIINEMFFGTDFVDFLTSFENVIIFIDEFEKVYAKQEFAVDLLSLMDGNFQTKFIFLLTVNTMDINYYLINRLNRVKYRKHYDSLDSNIIDEVANDMLVNKEHIPSIHKFFKKVGMCTFDLLINIIKEMNAFNENAIECGKYLNLQAETRTYNVMEIWPTGEETDLGNSGPINIQALGIDGEGIYFTRRTWPQSVKNTMTQAEYNEFFYKSNREIELYEDIEPVELPDGSFIIEHELLGENKLKYVPTLSKSWLVF